MEVDDVFIRLVEEARATLLLHQQQQLQLQQEKKRKQQQHQQEPSWAWVCMRLLSCCSAYPSGVTPAILLSDLFQVGFLGSLLSFLSFLCTFLCRKRWVACLLASFLPSFLWWLTKCTLLFVCLLLQDAQEKERLGNGWKTGDKNGGAAIRSSLTTVLDQQQKQQQLPRLPNMVTIDSIHEKKFVSLDSVLQVVILSVHLLPGTALSPSLSLSLCICIYLHIILLEKPIPCFISCRCFPWKATSDIMCYIQISYAWTSRDAFFTYEHLWPCKTGCQCCSHVSWVLANSMINWVFVLLPETWWKLRMQILFVY